MDYEKDPTMTCPSRSGERNMNRAPGDVEGPCRMPRARFPIFVGGTSALRRDLRFRTVDFPWSILWLHTGETTRLILRR